MTKCCGVDWAYRFSNAHESESADTDDTAMDLNNNEIGRAIYLNSPEASDDELARLIKSHSASCMSSGVTHDPTRLVYIKPCPSINVFDYGLSYDDIAEVILDEKKLGATPKGGERKFEMNDVRTGDHSLSVTCTLDGTQGKCGIAVELNEGLTFSDGTSYKEFDGDEGVSMSFTIVVPTLGDP